MTAINIIHVLFVAPMLMYVGAMNLQEKPIDPGFAIIIMFIAIGVFGYHLYRAYITRDL